MIRSAIVAVAVLIVSAAAANALQAAPVEIAIDLDTTGNTPTAFGANDACRSVNVGETFDIDVTAAGIAPVADGAGGIVGYSYNLHFDPAVVHVIAADNNVLLNADTPIEFLDADYTDNGAVREPLPATTGNLRIDFADLSPNYESGSGVLSRLTLEAVGAGSTDLTLDSELENQPAPVLLDAASAPYNVTKLQNARVTVGGACDAAPTPVDPEDTQPSPTPSLGPTPSPGPTGGPTIAPSVVPAGDTKLAVDVVTKDNSATSLGDIDTCAAADLGDTFKVDIVIQGVTDLLAWELPVNYDPLVLRIDDRNVQLFQAANDGSQVYDASASTPDISGHYLASAVDTADPVKPDSGDGILVRLIVTAIGEGTSGVTLDPVDLTNDDVPDRGILLRNAENAIIGDEDNDSFFDGPVASAEIRVGETCADGGRVEPGTVGENGTTGGSGDDGDSNTLWIVLGAIAAVVVVGGAGGLLLMRNRGAKAP